MSASDKKKLRKEENMAKLTERQQAEQKEAKQLKTNTLVFTIAIALVLCIGIGMIAYNWYASSGLPERFTTAVEIGEHKLSVAELNYYYIDILNGLGQDWYSMYLLQYEDGFQSSVALDQQQYKDEAGKTWGDHFIEEAIKEASGVLALCDEAEKAGYSLTEADKTTIEETMVALETEGTLYGYGNITDFLQAMYGNGAQEKTYRTYVENCTLAQSYYNHYVEALEYSDEAIADKDAEVPGAFSSFTYTYYDISPDDFIEHASEDEHDHSEDELAAALAQAKAVAEELVASGATNKEELDAAIANLEMHKTEEVTEDAAEDTTEGAAEETAEAGTDAAATEETTSTETTSDAATDGEAVDETTSDDSVEEPEDASAEDGEESTEEEEESVSIPTSTQNTDYEYDYIPTEIAEWLAADGRKAGQIGYVPYYAVDDEGEATEEVEGYYVVILGSEDKHEENLVSVRHILVAFEGGTTDEDTGDTVYSDEEKKAASDEAEKIKAEFEAGDKTESAFADLAKQYSDDNADEGGLYEDVYPGQMEAAFEDWCFDEARAAGDVGIVETSYGYHVMYFVETQEETYREYMITSTLRSEEADEWYTGLQDSYNSAAKVGSTSLMRTSIVLSN